MHGPKGRGGDSAKVQSEGAGVWSENVLPAYTAFIDSLKSDTAGHNSDLRLGKDAALALFRLREHVPWARGKPWPSFLTTCSDYVLLQDVVNVFKHGARHDGQVAKPTDIYESTVITDYEDAEGTYRHAEKEVTVHLRNRGSASRGRIVVRSSTTLPAKSNQSTLPATPTSSRSTSRSKSMSS